MKAEARGWDRVAVGAAILALTMFGCTMSKQIKSIGVQLDAIETELRQVNHNLDQSQCLQIGKPASECLAEPPPTP